MPCWYYDKKDLRNTPSIVRDNIDYETECRYRREGARFIMDAGTKMSLGYNTIATGVVYFHRFYMFHSFKTFPRYVTACCCLFLAGKVEETPKKCRDVVKTAKSLLTDAQFATFGHDPIEEVMTLERILLQTIKFDLQVDHPYKYLLKYAKCLKGDKKKLQEMVQMVWTFVNDSLCTTLSLQWEPEIIAVALMYLAGKLSKFEVQDWINRTPEHEKWWDMFVEDITIDLLEDICHQVLDLYSQSDTKPEDSPPMTPTPKTVKEKPPATVTSETVSGLVHEKPALNSSIPVKKPKTEPVPLPTNGCQPVEILDTTKIPKVAPHLPIYPSNYTQGQSAFPPVFPPVNITVPPPSINTINHLPQRPLHANVSGPSRPTADLGPWQHQYNPYTYPSNSNYFPNNAPVPSTNATRPYYPPQL